MYDNLTIDRILELFDTEQVRVGEIRKAIERLKARADQFEKAYMDMERRMIPTDSA